MKKIFPKIRALLPCRRTVKYFIFVLFMTMTIFLGPIFIPEGLVFFAIIFPVVSPFLLLFGWPCVIANWKDPSGWDKEASPGKSVVK
ncbi:MAG: hypothetical protein A2271_03710 [Candidatus Moranbacteria bacterium RIFOXYA12_FULL_35_19]|nr:MAG: hypothetical protein A2343_01360 [Candidatus Moranbacteria bacterium RIFOXYB12_FULL_35_8]OGI33368.1 MAG: hypothetical protein A2489_03905 [Candidatus Moranbacteria bacterium RIFOXYC12_FULL_36_13]OGI36282.1 MAG: hypothetical protein A2271_03710 [Candidatus Moranbacteria bacterium RIFOXYA12_FULL_35_19]